MLRSRKRRREEPLDARLLPDPIVVERAAAEEEGIDDPDPEHEALLADSVGLALLIVLERLSPAQRLAYVLHDIFSVPFEEISAPSSSARPRRRANSPAALAAASALLTPHC